MALTAKQIQAYIRQPAFTEPAISARATRRTVPEDVWRSLEIFPGLLLLVGDACRGCARALGILVEAAS